MAKVKQSKGPNTHSTWWCYPVSGFLVLCYMLPIYIMVMRSFKTISDYQHNLAFPVEWYPQNYLEVFQSDIWVGFKNSIILCLETVSLEIVVAALAAYGIARSSGAVVNALRKVNMLVMMIPGIALLVGTYSLMVSMKMTNELYGLALLSAAGGIPATMFMYVNFIISIPTALDEAAAIDGAGVVRTFMTIILPQLKAVTVTRIIMASTGCWNNYMMPMFLLTDKSKFTVILVIKQAFNRGNGAGNMPKACAACVVGLLPIIVLYLFLQKYIIEGQIDSSVK